MLPEHILYVEVIFPQTFLTSCWRGSFSNTLPCLKRYTPTLKRTTLWIELWFPSYWKQCRRVKRHCRSHCTHKYTRYKSVCVPAWRFICVEGLLFSLKFPFTGFMINTIKCRQLKWTNKEAKSVSTAWFLFYSHVWFIRFMMKTVKYWFVAKPSVGPWPAVYPEQ